MAHNDCHRPYISPGWRVFDVTRSTRPIIPLVPLASGYDFMEQELDEIISPPPSPGIMPLLTSLDGGSGDRPIGGICHIETSWQQKPPSASPLELENKFYNESLRSRRSRSSSPTPGDPSRKSQRSESRSSPIYSQEIEIIETLELSPSPRKISGYEDGHPGIRGRGNLRDVKGNHWSCSTYRGREVIGGGYNSDAPKSRGCHFRSRSRSKSGNRSRSRPRPKVRYSHSRSRSPSRNRDQIARSSHCSSNPTTSHNAHTAFHSTKDVHTVADCSSFQELWNDGFTTDEILKRDQICQEWALGNIKIVSLIANNEKRKLMKAHENENRVKEKELYEARRKLELYKAVPKKFRGELPETQVDSQISQFIHEVLQESLKHTEEKCQALEATNAELLKQVECRRGSLQQSQRDSDGLGNKLGKVQDEIVAMENCRDRIKLDLKQKEMEKVHQWSVLKTLDAKKQEDLKSLTESKMKLDKCEKGFLYYKNKANTSEAEIKALKDAQEHKDKIIAELEYKLSSGVGESQLAAEKERYRKEVESFQREMDVKLQAEKDTIAAMKSRMQNIKTQLKLRLSQVEKKSELGQVENLEEKLEMKADIIDVSEVNAFKETDFMDAIQRHDTEFRKSSKSSGSSSTSAKVSLDLSKVASIMDILKSKRKQEHNFEGNGSKKR